MHTEHAERKRDLRLRRLILRLMHAARVGPGNGWMSGRFVVDTVDGIGHATDATFADDAHAAALIHDLVAGGYAEQRDERTRTYQKPCPMVHTSYRITHKGTALVEEQIDPDPLVEDHRVRRTRADRG